MAATASTWFYVQRILIPQQVAEAATRNEPRGNFSDLYPRWLGARELLLHGRNPYSAEITREIQQGYYGRPVNPGNPGDPKDQQAFAYPAYVVFLLAPTVTLPFETVRIGFRDLLFALALVDVFLWIRILRWKPSPMLKLTLGILALGWLPMVQGIKLQQITLFVMGLIGACVLSLAAGYLSLAGFLLALATIKPQLTFPLVAWLLVWAISDWRARRRFVIGFLGTMLLLLIGAQLVLPGWTGMFVDAVRQYRHYTDGRPLLVSLLGPVLGWTAMALAVSACLAKLWSSRNISIHSPDFGRTVGVVLALTVLVIPTSSLYNQVLMIPAILALSQSESLGSAGQRVGRLAWIIGGCLLVWPWISAIGLCFSYPWLVPNLRARVTVLPFYTSLMLPVFVLGLALLDLWTRPALGLRENAIEE